MDGSQERITAVYHVESTADAIEARAQAIAVEQSVEVALAVIDDAFVRDSIVGRVDKIQDLGGGRFEVRIGLAAATTGAEPGQLLNMLFGNTSLQPDVVLHDALFPAGLAAAFGGPRHGVAGFRRRAGASRRALTCAALKPQGLGPDRLAALAGRLARGGVDVIKDDHGLADQSYGRFADRVPACAAAVRQANAVTGGASRYAPSVSGDLDTLRQQVRLAASEGVDTVLIAPMLVGLPAFHRLVRDCPEIAFLAHPAMAGAARIAPALLLGRIFRMLGADATVFPHAGGRFGYTPAMCRALADAARGPLHALEGTLPTPGGGLTRARVPEILEFYGPDVMLLIGGDLLAAGDRLVDAARAFTDEVARLSEAEATIE
ncbi:MAG: ribulose 1,5-bisphosphate carboxylase [Rhodospirillales bacterium]|nr:MAG: ribulose 1,5-bisphosphate carboxylase [Rhodospirillales bacterium]